MPLTDTAVRNAKRRERPQKLSDGGGLHLLVNPDGARYWRMAYRYQGRQKTLALGVYPIVSLADGQRGTRQKNYWRAVSTLLTHERKLGMIDPTAPRSCTMHEHNGSGGFNHEKPHF